MHAASDSTIAVKGRSRILVWGMEASWAPKGQD